MASITVYSKPSCVQCNATYRKLDELRADYTVIDITVDEAAADMVKSLGYLQAPVVVAQTPAGGRHWSGYKPDDLTAAASAQTVPETAAA